MKLSDYEAFLQTPELLNLQRETLCFEYPYMMGFIVVHQSTELWLKLTSFNLLQISKLLLEGRTVAAVRRGRELSDYIKTASNHLSVLENIPPIDYHHMRSEFGNGSGFSSPGWKTLRSNAKQFYLDFITFLHKRSLSIADVYSDPDLMEFQIAESLVDLDNACLIWRHRHTRLIERLIGANATGTAGTPLSVLHGLANERLFPELWATERTGENVRYD